MLTNRCLAIVILVTILLFFGFRDICTKPGPVRLHIIAELFQGVVLGGAGLAQVMVHVRLNIITCICWFLFQGTVS
jgi:hypothetical protein